jgi:hypothetical protein
MAENSPKGTLQGISQAWGNPKAKKGMLLAGGVLAVVIGASFAMSSGEKSTIPAAAKLNLPPEGPRGDPLAESSPAYKDLVRSNDRQRAEEALNDPMKTVLPKVSGLTDPSKKYNDAASGQPSLTPQTPVQPPLAQPSIQPVYAQSGQGAQQATEQNARAGQAYQNASQLLSKMVEKSMASPSSGQWGIVTPPEKQGQGGMQQVGAGPQGSNPVTGGVPQQPAKVLVRAGEALFATLDTAINTDYSGPVVATIRQGKYAGSRLIGQKSLEFDAVVLKFNQMSPADGGPMLMVNAFAIMIDDVKSFGLTGIQGEKDYHAFQRYFLPAIAKFAQGYAFAASIPNSQVITSPGGAIQSQSALSDKDRMIVAGGAAVDPIVKDLDRLSSRPITISLPANTEIGILFATDVTDRMQPVAQVEPVPGQPAQPGQAAVQPQLPNGYASQAQLRAQQSQAQARQLEQQYGVGYGGTQSGYGQPGYGQPYYGGTGGMIPGASSYLPNPIPRPGIR